MTKSRINTECSKPENSRRKRRLTDPESDPEFVGLPGFGDAIEEEGVSPVLPEYLESLIVTDVPPAETRVKSKRTISGLTSRVVLEIQFARRELAAAAAEVERLKDALAVNEREPSIQSGGGSRRARTSGALSNSRRPKMI